MCHASVCDRAVVVIAKGQKTIFIVRDVIVAHISPLSHLVFGSPLAHISPLSQFSFFCMTECEVYEPLWATFLG